MVHPGFAAAAAQAFKNFWGKKPKHKVKDSFFHRFMANRRAKKLHKEREKLREETKNFEIAKLPPDMLELPKNEHK
ncbi:hypothetical protein COU37_01265 [Candidatus Micrarchaeota archaeon CG10_big_fil_rev_8_21_14_0_10_45_29]|nr:MAG: hypothetical protein COU37_01265 [Candidatus Micrarchaeota archaeon CG10_big_fil_rev_8_21_14_0_10_45_29]